MQIKDTEIPEVKLLRAVRHADSRGFFSEVYREDALRTLGIDIRFVQENRSISMHRGVLRGLHFQIPPFAQAKLLWVAAGSIIDIAVDIRWGSPTFGRHVAVALSASEWTQTFVPEGFAHGFCALEPNTQVIYKVSSYYSAAHERGIYWEDPALGIDWPLGKGEAMLSEKDRNLPMLADLPRFFQYEP
jgi:dTDP-4-dehydrorhamnose 3,5-epimerase